MKAVPYFTGLRDRGQHKTNSSAFLPSFLPLLYKGMQIGEIWWLLWANPLHGFRLLENHSRTENKPPGRGPCLSYPQCWFICWPEYVIKCLMDSLFISELTLSNIYIIKDEHMFSIYERKSYFRGFYEGRGYLSLWEPILKNIELHNHFYHNTS